LRGFAAAEEGEGAFAGSVHDALVFGDGVELAGDVGEVGGAAVFDGVLEGFELGIETEAVVAEFDVEAAALFDGEGDGAELVGDALEDGIGGPDKGTGAAAVGSGVGEGFVAGEGEAGLITGAAGLKEAVGAGVVEEAGAERFVELDGAIDGGGKDVVARVADRAGLGGEAAFAGFVDGDGVVGGL